MECVVCWCCGHYEPVFKDTIELGLCIPCKKVVSAFDNVCEEFVLRKGLHTRREIPDYCKNYN